MLTRDRLASHALFALCALCFAMSADAASNRIRMRDGGSSDDTVVIDETSNPPMLTVSPGVAVSVVPGKLVDLGGGRYEILIAGDAEYHLKARGGVDHVTIIDGPGSSRYWIGVGAEGDTVLISDGPGDDRYKIEGKSGDDVYEIVDDEGNDLYYVKGAKGADQISLTDGPGDDVYKVKARSEANLEFTDESGGDQDLVKTKGIDFDP